MLIEDGKGTGTRAHVTGENMLRVYAQVESEISHVSENEEEAYSWPAAAANLGADKNIIWVRNDDTAKNLIIESICIGSVTIAAVEIWVGSGSTVGGAEVAGVNLNRTSANVALATCRTANTNCDAGSGLTLAVSTYVPVGAHCIELHGALILGYLDEVAVNIVTDTDLSAATILGYYHSVE